jgi:hypothetical protein
MDPDRYTRYLHPVSVVGIGPTNTTSSNSTLNSYEDHRWDFDYTSLLRLGRFSVIVELSGTYKITYAGTPPQQQQFTLSGNGPEDGVIVKIKCAASALLIATIFPPPVMCSCRLALYRVKPIC